MSRDRNGDSDTALLLERIEGGLPADELMSLACSAESPRVRMAALEHLDDDEALVEVVEQAHEIDVRLAAVARIDDQQRLAQILKVRRNYRLMGAIFARLTDEKVLQQIAEDTGYPSTARRIAVEHFADQSYLADVEGEAPDKEDAPPVEGEDARIESLLNAFGGTKVVRAIGRFRNSERAVRALGRLARRREGEVAEQAVDYLCRALESPNPQVRSAAQQQLGALEQPELVDRLVRALDDPKLEQPIRAVLQQIDSPSAQAALAALNSTDEQP
jgi:HEAT repeat protein